MVGGGGGGTVTDAIFPTKFVFHYPDSKKNILKKVFFCFTSGFSDNQSPSASISHTVPFFGGTFLQKYLSFSLSTFSLLSSQGGTLSLTQKEEGVGKTAFPSFFFSLSLLLLLPPKKEGVGREGGGSVVFVAANVGDLQCGV